jgi:predicted nucleotidyltransferase
MRNHHRRAIEQAQARLIGQNPRLLAIIVGGSIAKGTEREDSDVDLIVVLPDEEYRQRLDGNRLAFHWSDLCDYNGGYVEGRFVSRSYVKEAAARGSEPTRHSFTGTFPVYCVDPDIATWLPLIPTYPEDRRAGNIAAFLAQMQLNRGFFWSEGKRRNDQYLQMRAATEIILFGCRLILAHNRILFACQKRLVEQVLAAPNKPDGLEDKINRLLTEMTDDAKEDFCKAIESLADWGKVNHLVQHLNRFLQDVEMSWFNRVHAVSEW